MKGVKKMQIEFDAVILVSKYQNADVQVKNEIRKALNLKPIKGGGKD